MTEFPGLRPSADHQREMEARQRGERIQSPVRAKASLDAAALEYERFKLARPAEQGAPERAEAARQEITNAKTQRELDKAFMRAYRLVQR